MTDGVNKITDDFLKILKSHLQGPAAPRKPSALSKLLAQGGIAWALDESVLPADPSAPPFADSGSETIEVVLKRLASTTPKPEPEELTVTGVFFGCHLLYPGWWARPSTHGRLPTGFWTDAEGASTVRNIRHWLNSGFEQWGPSWNLADPGAQNQYVYGQIGHGDEANSLPVIVAPSIALRLRAIMGSRLAIGVVATGVLYHCTHKTTHLRQEMQLALQRMIEAGGGDMPYYLVVDDKAADGSKSNAPGKINLSKEKPSIYSAYMWQCLIRKQDRALGLAGTVPIENTVFLWEHTNLLDSDSIKFNHQALRFKKRYLERELGEKLLVLQHSYPVDEIVGDRPAKLLIKPSVLSTILARARARLHEQSPRHDP